jgi:hypothetical protein
MSSDFVSEFVEKHGVDLRNINLFNDLEIVVSFFETVMRSSGVPVKVSIGPEMMHVIGSGIEMETTLHKTLQTYSQQAENAEDMRLLLQSVGAAFLNNMRPTYDGKTVWLALMNKAQIDVMNADFKTRADGLDRPSDDLPILYRQNADLYVSPVIETEVGLLPVTERISRTLGVERNALFDLGLGNLRRKLAAGDLQVREDVNGLSSVHSVLPPAGALFLLPEFWNQQEERLGAAPIVRIIHGDTLVFASSKAARQPKLAYRTETGGFIKPISDDVFLWNGSDLVKYRTAA